MHYLFLLPRDVPGKGDNFAVIRARPKRRGFKHALCRGLHSGARAPSPAKIPPAPFPRGGIKGSSYHLNKTTRSSPFYKGLRLGEGSEGDLKSLIMN